MEWRSKTADTAPRYDQPDHDALLHFGALGFLSALCPMHKSWPAARLHAVFGPAVAHNQLRIFNDDAGYPRAALLWANLSDEAHLGLVQQARPVQPTEWNSGPHLWVMDVIAPFGHGKHVARFLARNPPPQSFYYLRTDHHGRMQRIIECDIRRGKRGLIRVVRSGQPSVV